jgi:uncharacterized protein DUF5709
MSENVPEPDGDAQYNQGLDTGGGDDVLDLDETLGSDNVDDVLDTSYSPPEKPLGMDRFGTTLNEQEQGESLDQRLAEEIPDPALAVDDDEDDIDEQADAGGEVGGERAGRLVDSDGGVEWDTEKDLVGREIGIDGGAASAEEAAVHVIADDDTDELYDEALSEDLEETLNGEA